MSYTIDIVADAMPRDKEAWLLIHALREELYAHAGNPSPRLRALHDALTAKYPCITTDSNGPWSDGPLINDFGQKMAILGIGVSRVREVLPFVIRTATAMGFTVLDAQDQKIHRPAATAARPRAAPTDRPDRPVGVVVAAVITMMTGVVVALWEIGGIGVGTPGERLTAWCFMLGGLGAVAGGIAVWLRAQWARVPLGLWIGAMVAGFVSFERLDAGLLMALAFVCGPQAAVAWYLDRWSHREPQAALEAPAERAVLGAPLLILLALVAPPIMAAVAAVGFAAAGGEAGMIAYVLLVPAQLGFIVALARRAASAGVRVTFVVLALASSLVSTLVVLLGSAVK